MPCVAAETFSELGEHCARHQARRPIQDDADRAVLVVLQHEHDGVREVDVGEGRRCDEQRAVADRLCVDGPHGEAANDGGRDPGAEFRAYVSPLFRCRPHRRMITVSAALEVYRFPGRERMMRALWVGPA
jgi:hypothetical protein